MHPGEGRVVGTVLQHLAKRHIRHVLQRLQLQLLRDRLAGRQIERVQPGGAPTLGSRANQCSAPVMPLSRSIRCVGGMTSARPEAPEQWPFQPPWPTGSGFSRLCTTVPKSIAR
jgi:hypothetical protein